MPLVDAAASRPLTSLPFAAGHGATANDLGSGLIYYTLALSVRARICVCLGSGGGFVPCLMRQAQRDLGLEFSRTFLVDAILPEAGYGSPELPGGWMDAGGHLSQSYPEITALNCLTQDAGHGFFRKNRFPIDFLHIDADHSCHAVTGDFETFAPLLQPKAFVTLHDSSRVEVRQAIEEIVRRFPEFQCLDMPDLGAGIAVLRRRQGIS